MTTIAWDGKTLAADRQGSDSDMARTTTKIRKTYTNKYRLIGFSGNYASGLMMEKWFFDGADPEKFPECQKNDDLWSRLIVVTQDSGVFVYERQPIPLPVEDEFSAWGSGRDYAMGAMANGASAAEAVGIACRFDVYSGLGIDVLSFD